MSGLAHRTAQPRMDVHCLSLLLLLLLVGSRTADVVPRVSAKASPLKAPSVIGHSSRHRLISLLQHHSEVSEERSIRQWLGVEE
ncbi:unnamed protein product [Lampetra planeri]